MRFAFFCHAALSTCTSLILELEQILPYHLPGHTTNKRSTYHPQNFNMNTCSDRSVVCSKSKALWELLAPSLPSSKVPVTSKTSTRHRENMKRSTAGLLCSHDHPSNYLETCSGLSAACDVDVGPVEPSSDLLLGILEPDLHVLLSFLLRRGPPSVLVLQQHQWLTSLGISQLFSTSHSLCMMIQIAYVFHKCF